jgi:hypothetical protein
MRKQILTVLEPNPCCAQSSAEGVFEVAYPYQRQARTALPPDAW